MPVFKLKGAVKDYIWGGMRLARDFGKIPQGDRLAESWELSCHPDGPSVVCGGEFDGRELRECLSQHPEWCGKNCGSFDFFPVLIKLIDAQDNLSIQVHPDNEYALKNEGQLGKTEMWYIVDAAPGAFIYYGFEREISKEEFSRRITENTLTDILRRVDVKAGDCFFIPAGTLHAIGAGCLIAEVQQNSNVTYRIYDYGRIGADGKPRELHTEKALDVTRLCPAQDFAQSGTRLAKCDYFTADLLDIDGTDTVTADENSFVSLLVLEGGGKLSSAGGDIELSKGDSVFVTAGSGDATLGGKLRVLCTRV